MSKIKREKPSILELLPLYIQNRNKKWSKWYTKQQAIKEINEKLIK